MLLGPKSVRFWKDCLFSGWLVIPKCHRHCFGNEDLHHRLPAYAAFLGLVAQPPFHVRPELPFAGQEICDDLRFALAGFFLESQQGVCCVNRKFDICGAPFLHVQFNSRAETISTQSREVFSVGLSANGQSVAVICIYTWRLIKLFCCIVYTDVYKHITTCEHCQTEQAQA